MRVTDVSRGGMSLRSPIYVPRTAELRVDVHVPGSDERLALRLQIKSVAMIDRGPMYVIGGQFADVSGEGQARVDRLLLVARAGTAERREPPRA